MITDIITTTTTVVTTVTECTVNCVRDISGELLFPISMLAGMVGLIIGVFIGKDF